ncbi:MAG: hypothetical protein H7Y05_12005 [Steroidobacteraceae bacterium]|nr:hypothetical protein [Deltaproteobacteria bacterium]
MRSLGKSFQLAATALASVIALTACGGSDGGTSTAGIGGVEGAAVSKGVVTAKGSVFVNGIEFSTTGATVTIDGVSATEDKLQVGMVVKVSGASDDATKKGTAIKIEAQDALEGKIESVDAPNNTITVMGQVVQIEDNLTRLNDLDTLKTFTDATTAPVGAPAALKVGDTVEVHGFADDTGRLRATRVAKKAIDDFDTKGIVTGFVAGAPSFGLSTPGRATALTVTIGTAVLPVGITNGSLVEVKTLTVPAIGATTITASTIRLEDKLGAENEKVEVEGLVSSGTVADFVINGQKVTTNASTVFEGGLKADFVLGSKLEAEGPLNASGAIVATKISFRSNIRIEAAASGVTASGLTLLGKSIAINKFTRMDDGLPLSTSHVQVRAMLDRNGNLVATRIRIITSGNPKTFVQGPVSVSGGAMTILGFPVATNASTQFRISTDAPADQAVSSANFFAQLKSGVTVVKVRWASGDTTLPVEEAEIELGK